MNNTISGNATYYLAPDVDTDIIIPARFLTRTSLDGFEPYAFFERRYLPETVCAPNMEAKDFVFEKTALNTDFPPNHPHCQNATFLLTWSNFGCGSSREHAVYSLRNYQVIIGSAMEGQAAFADIFRDNCRQNLIWTPVLKSEDHRALKLYLQEQLAKNPVRLTLNTQALTLASEDGEINLPFSIPENHIEFFKNSEGNPFQTAQKAIAKDLEKITRWENANANLLKKFPNSSQ